MKASWTADELNLLRGSARVYGGDLAQLAALFERPRAEINLALDALLGRTPAEAEAALAAGRREIVEAAPRRSVANFVRAIFHG